MAKHSFDPLTGDPMIPYGPAETALYSLVETFEQDGMTAAQWAAVHDLRDAILRYDSDDEEEFSNSWEYNYFSDRYTYQPEKEFSVTVVTKSTITVKARTKRHAERLAEEAFENNGMAALDEMFEVSYEDTYEK